MAVMQTLSLRRRMLAVLAGGFCGTLARYLLSLFVQAHLGKAWPYDILLINITGAFLLSFITSLADATVLVGPTRRLFLNVGFLGAYTTFSSFMLGADQLALTGAVLAALLYLFLSLFGGICVVLLGDWLAQLLIARVRPAAAREAIAKKSSLKVPAGHADNNDHKLEHIDIKDDVISS
ncbi:MAG TPA: fluoride efflux transporter CrcB [Ktedonobacteraceae bacterium]|jgi:CrcB protein|nr:fluoride efflux transporter CrcB [Ktedonobacteraceae bacterium]